MKTQIGHNLNYAARLLSAGGLVSVPTETVYGLGANAFDPRAVMRIFATKGRPAFDPLITHISHPFYLHRVVAHYPDWARALGHKFWPGPLTLVLPRHPKVPAIVSSGLPTVGVRIPAHPITRALLQQLPFPIAAPSANLFGRVSPTEPLHVKLQLNGRIPYILDGGPCHVGVESTIVGLNDQGKLAILRPGGLSREDIEAVVGPVEVNPHSTDNPTAPGMLSSHYAPDVPLLFNPSAHFLKSVNWQRTAVLAFDKLPKGITPTHHALLSPNQNLNQAARNLFSTLRRLAMLPVDLIVAFPVPNHGLGLAINDRLKRAGGGRSV